MRKKIFLQFFLSDSLTLCFISTASQPQIYCTSIDRVKQKYIDPRGSTPVWPRVRCIHTFLLSLKQIWANMDPIRFIFACFDIFSNTIYSHHSLRITFKIFAHIHIQIFDLVQNKLMLRQIFASERIFTSTFSRFGQYSLQNICLKANIRYILLQII